MKRVLLISCCRFEMGGEVEPYQGSDVREAFLYLLPGIQDAIYAFWQKHRDHGGSGWKMTSLPCAGPLRGTELPSPPPRARGPRVEVVPPRQLARAPRLLGPGRG